MNLFTFTIVWLTAILFLYITNYSRWYGLSVLEPMQTKVYLNHRNSKNGKPIRVQPKLKFNDTVVARIFSRLPASICQEKKNWVTVSGGAVHFSKELLSSQGSCDYFPLLREDDNKVTLGRSIVGIEDGFKIPSDFSRILCKANGGETYDGIHAGVADMLERAQFTEDPLKNGFEGLSVAILGFSSMSRQSWMRQFRSTRAYFHETLGAVELEGHTIVGGGTTEVLFPMLTGKFEWELPECRRNFPGATTLDDFPFIWHEMKRAGYLTSWANAAPHSAPFNYHMMGFKHPPTDFYTRPFYIMAQNMSGNLTQSCFGSQSFSQVWFNYFMDVFHVYRERRKFLFHYLVDTSNDCNNYIKKLDEDLKDTVQQLHLGGHLNTTLLILMGDHGAGYNEARGSWSGKLEERLPYVALLFPDWFQKKYPQAMKNLRTNSKRLTTPFDLHETLKDFLEYRGSGKGDKRQRGISLFKEIPLDRSCEDAGIAPHWCACLAWDKVSATEPGVQLALQAVMDKINKFTAPYRSQCALLSVAHVNSAFKFQKEARKLSKSDLDGRFDFHESHQIEGVIYHLAFLTYPGGGHFEATVSQEGLKEVITLNDKDISRINKYEDAPPCVITHNRNVLHYCYCKTK